MVTVSINGDSRSLADADPQWVTQEVNGRRHDGQTVCVRIRIQEPGLDVALSTPTCSNGFGGGRAPNLQEQKILALWAHHHLNAGDFPAGEVVAFLRQLRSVL